MKKPFIKVVALVLALVLSFGAIPMVASAEETTAVPAAICTHPHLFENYYFEYINYGDTEYHKHVEVATYLCAVCGYSAEEIVCTTYEKHIVETWTLWGYNDTVVVYRGECKYCGQQLLLAM